MSKSFISVERESLQTKYNNARINLLLVVAFTVINIVMLAIQSDSYFLFSAYIPYIFVYAGMFICGKFPAEYYVDEFADLNPLGSGAFSIFIAIAVVIVLLYLLCWIFSKNNKNGWLITALVLFAIDTAVLLFFAEIKDSIIDIIFHIWVVVSLSIGINTGAKLKKLPKEEESTVGFENNDSVEQSDIIDSSTQTNSPIIRLADTTAKSKILLECSALGHTITYRRVKKVNELVIDGNVYDDFEALIENAHVLNATIDGHTVEVGYDGRFHSYAKVDGLVIAKKIRLA